jgi:threonine dehydrogenase-like Zn-dependent dehydrogenase
MQALRVDGGKVAVTEVATPAAEGEVLVRVTMSGVCNTDLEIGRGYAGFRGTIGHEFVGVVEDAGGEDSVVARGDRVVGEINAGCGVCDRCRRGDPRHCPSRTVLGIVGRDGAHAEYLRLPARNLVRVPASIPDDQAVFVEPLAAACGVLERCSVDRATRVAVVGDGKLGLLCAMALAANHVDPCIVGKHATKLSLARSRGLTAMTIDEARGHRRAFDVVVEASGAASGFELALDLLVPQGTLVLKSTFHGSTSLDAARVVVDEIRVVGSRCGRFAPAVDLLARGAVDVGCLVSDVLSLEHGVEAMALAARAGVLKVLLRTSPR